MMIRHSVITLALAVVGCGGTSHRNDRATPSPAPWEPEAPTSSDASPGSSTIDDTQATDRATVTADAAGKLSASLAESGLEPSEVDVILAAARTRTTALPLDASQARYFYAFAQGAAEALNEALVAHFDAPELSAKAAGAIVQALIAMLYGNPAYALLPAEDIATMEQSILQGSIAGLFQCETIADLTAKLHDSAGSAPFDKESGDASTTTAHANLERLMLSLQMSRAELLAMQLGAQITMLQSRSEAITEANLWLDLLKKEAQGNTCSGSGGIYKYEATSTTITTLKTKYGFNANFRANMSAQEKCAAHENLAQQLTQHIDSLLATSTMDDRRLQSLTGKQNEAFAIVSNFVKKMADSRAAILGDQSHLTDENAAILKSGRAFDARMLAKVAASFIAMAADGDFAEASLDVLLARFVEDIGQSNFAARLDEPLQILGETLAQDLVALDVATAATLTQRAAQGALSGAIHAFDDQALAVQMNGPLAAGFSKGMGTHEAATMLHESMATGHLQALIAIAGKAPGTGENPEAGNDAVRMAFKIMLDTIRSALEQNPEMFYAYLDAAQVAAEAATTLWGTPGYDVIWNPLEEVAASLP